MTKKLSKKTEDILRAIAWLMGLAVIAIAVYGTLRAFGVV